MSDALRLHEKMLVITSALSSAGVLYFESVFDHYHTRRYNLTVLILATVCCTAALIVVVAAVVFLLTDSDLRISVDVFSAALIGLSPAVSAIPRLKLRRVFVTIKSLLDPALQAQLVYARRGSPPRSIPQSTAVIYLREEVKHHRPPDNKLHVGEREWHGTIRGYTEQVVRLRDDQDGDAKRWLRACLSTHVLSNPRVVGLETCESALNAHALLADLIRIGDLVWECFEIDMARELKENQGVRSSFGSSTGSICERFVTELELHGWTLSARNTIPEWPSSTESRARRYRIVFNILAEKSNHFRRRDRRYHALRILRDLEEKGLDEARKSMRNWLEGWGF